MPKEQIFPTIIPIAPRGPSARKEGSVAWYRLSGPPTPASSRTRQCRNPPMCIPRPQRRSHVPRQPRAATAHAARGSTRRTRCRRGCLLPDGHAVDAGMWQKPCHFRPADGAAPLSAPPPRFVDHDHAHVHDRARYLAAHTIDLHRVPPLCICWVAHCHRCGHRTEPRSRRRSGRIPARPWPVAHAATSDPVQQWRTRSPTA
jgi:hypothetical protein